MAKHIGLHYFGWHNSIPDKRDKKYSVPSHVAKKTFPDVISLITKCPPVYNQETLGSCTANGIAFGMQFIDMKEGLKDTSTPSRLFIYYNERAMEGSVDSDSGASIRDGIKSVANLGVCDETEWTYDITKFKIKPSEQCYTDALSHKAIEYSSIDNTQLDDILGCLVEGFPVVFGMTVYESFEKVGKNGMVPMPKRNESALGGHCMGIVGFNRKTKRFMVRNSWGNTWGDNGICYIPFQYLTDADFADDFWTIRKS